MSDTRNLRGNFWPAAFFVLNIGALILWFYWSGFFMAREIGLRSVTPGGVELDAAAIDKIEVEFDAPLDPATVGADAIRLIPPIAGKSELAGGGTIRYLLSERPRPATAYQVLWSPKIRGTHGQIAPQDLKGFSTARFAFVGARQTAFDPNSYTVELSFNQPIRAVDLEGALKSRFSLESDSRGDEPRLRLVTSGTAAVHQARIRETRSSYVGLTLPAGLAGVDGGLGLKDDVELVWKLAGADAGEKKPPEWAAGKQTSELAPVLSYLGMAGEWEGASAVVTVRMTAPLDIATARQFVKIEPDLPVTFSSSWGKLRISGDFRPGKQYRITLKPGLSAGDAGALRREISRNVWFDDLPSRLDFAFGGGYLLPGGLLKVPVASVNLDKFAVAVRRLYANNLVEMALRDYDPDVEEDYAGPVREAEMTIARRPNQAVETLLDLRQLTGEEPAGVYGLEVHQVDRRWNRKSAAIVVSDIGLGARTGKDQVLTWTLSLASGKPLPDCKITVYSNRRQLLAEGQSGRDGVVNLPLPQLPEGEKPVLVIAESGREMTFVRLDNNLRARGADSAQGAPYPGEYEAFVAAERGVYRGGETIRASALIRDSRLAEAPVLPVDLALLNPGGKTIAKTRVSTDPQGRALADLTLPKDAEGGQYRIEARLPGGEKELGSTVFRLADYLPVTLNITLSLPEIIPANQPSILQMAVKRLAGGETGSLPGAVLVSFGPAPFRPDAWRDWTFGDTRRAASARKQLERRLDLREDGTGKAEWDIPDLDTPAAIAMSVRAEISEPGGRAATASLERVVHPLKFYLGAKVEGDRVVAGQAAVFNLAAVTPEGGVFPPAHGWKARLYRIEYNGLLKRRSDGRLIHDWQRLEIPAGEAEGEWAGGNAEFSLGLARGGSYRLAADSPGGKGVTLDFEVGGAGNDWTGEDPEALEIKLTAADHPIGSAATASIKAPFAGQALITLETDRIIRHWVKELAAGENAFEFPVGEELRPNAFLTAIVVRPAGAEASWKPHRASGAARVNVDNRDRRLDLDLAAPESFSPGKTAEVRVKVTDPLGGGAGGAAVVLWGVDLGILSLTDYRTPSPWDYFSRRRRLEVTDADMYSRLAPEVEEWRGGKEAAPGGDAGSGSDDLGRRLNPVSAERVKAVAVHLGNLTADQEGNATARFLVPEAATRLRLMAWAAAGGKSGATEREVEIRAPISLSASWPRFAAPGDEFQIHVALLNRSGGDGRATLSATGEGGLELNPAETPIDIPDGLTRTVILRGKARHAGVAKATLLVRLGDDSFRQTIELPVRPPVMFQRLAGVVEVAPGKREKLTPAKNLLVPGGRVAVAAGGSPQLKLANCLEYLVAYPYECAEQTASRLAGLLFLPDLLALSRPGQIGPEESANLVKLCLDRLAAMQNRNGGFRMWPTPGDSEFWVSAQILYILEECRAAGLDVPASLLAPCRSYLQDHLDRELALLATPSWEKNTVAVRQADGEDAALACLALAKANDIRRSWLVRLDEIASARAKAGAPLATSALAFHCEAVALAGDPAKAAELFAQRGPASRQGGLTGSQAFANAAWISAGLRLGLPTEKLVGLASMLDRDLTAGRKVWNTRETAWIVMAMGQYWRRHRPDAKSLAWVKVADTASLFPALQGKSWHSLQPGVEIEAEARDGGPFYLSWRAEGVPASGQAVEEDAGLTARRRVFNANGAEVALPYTLKQGEVYEIRLVVEGEAEDLVIADLLPAGLEIEDPDLKGRRTEAAAEAALPVRQVERKDDRLLVFGSVAGKGEHRYLCRAVTPGDYVWPALDASRMYEPEIRSVHGQNKLRVEAMTREKPATAEGGKRP